MGDTISMQKCDKASGPANIHMEAFIHGSHRLQLLLSCLFNLFLHCGYVPDAFHRATIIPLVKCKTGDMTDVNNYRAIALSNSITKILESLLYKFIDSQHAADEYQSGFYKEPFHSNVLISLRKLLVIIDRMVAMCLPVLSTSTRRLITLTTGFCFVN